MQSSWGWKSFGKQVHYRKEKLNNYTQYPHMYKRNIHTNNPHACLPKCSLSMWVQNRQYRIYSLYQPLSIYVFANWTTQSIHMLTHMSEADLFFQSLGKHTPKQDCNLIKGTWCNLDQMLIRSHISLPIRDPSVVIPCALYQARYVLPAV